MKISSYLLLSFLFVFFSCVTPLNLSSEFDESIDFDAYNTFIICQDDLLVENTSYPQHDNIEVRQIIADKVEKQMQRRGFKTNVQKPQLQAGFRILLSHEETTFTNCDVQTEYDYWKTCTINKETYTRETLVLYVSDMDKNQVIWQAKIDCDLNKSKSALNNYVEELVETVFTEFPIPYKSSVL